MATTRDDTPVRVAGIGHALPGEAVPGQVLGNEELTELMAEVRAALEALGTPRHFDLSTPDFPYERLGIRRRRVLDSDYTARDLAVAAGRDAMQKSGRAPADVEVVIVTTVTPDRVVPAVATTVQDSLGLGTDVMAFDLALGCNGFVAALDTAARSLLTRPLGTCALVIAAETMLRILDASDRTTCPVFGDGAGAIVLERCDAGSLRLAAGETFGNHGDLIEIRADYRDEPLYRFESRAGRLGVFEEKVRFDRVVMHGRRVFMDMIRHVPRSILRYMHAAGRTVADIDAFVFHQANRRMIEAIAKDRELAIPGEKLVFDIEDLGNTTSASIPILLSRATAAGRLCAGHRVLIAGFGTGYSIGLMEVTL